MLLLLLLVAPAIDQGPSHEDDEAQRLQVARAVPLLPDLPQALGQRYDVEQRQVRLRCRFKGLGFRF